MDAGSGRIQIKMPDVNPDLPEQITAKLFPSTCFWVGEEARLPKNTPQKSPYTLNSKP